MPSNFCSRPVAVTGRKYLRHRPIDANQICYFIFLTRLRLLLAGDISVLAQLILLFYFIFLIQPVAVTGRRHLRHRPVDCFILFYLPNMWLSLVGGICTIARLNCSFISLYQPEVASRRPVDFTLPY